MARPWIKTASVVVVAWVAGIAFWGSAPVGESDVDGATRDLGIGSAVGVALTALAGLARAVVRDTNLRLGALALLAIGWSLWVFVWSFGGFCLDPGDVCTLTWGTHATHVAVAMIAIAVGALAEDVTKRVRPN